MAKVHADMQNRGRKKLGKLSPQTRVIRAAVTLLGRGANANTVLALLSGEEIEGLAASDGMLEEIRTELAHVGPAEGDGTVLDPVEFKADGPLVEVEDSLVFFRFLNRSEHKMTIARFRNAVSEASPTRS